MAYTQSTKDILKQQAGEGVKEGAKTVTVDAGEKATDKILSKIFDHKKKRKKSDLGDSNNSNNTVGTNSNQSIPTKENNSSSKENSGESTPAFNTYSKFDFIPGDKILAYDDFSKDAIGDFPATWNTNSSGEVVTSSSRQGHWLMLTKPGKYIPEYIKSLPDNFTFEYDITCNENYNDYSPALSVSFLTGPNGSKDLLDNWYMADGKRDGVKFSVQPTGGANTGYAFAENFEDANSVMRNQVPITQFNNKEGKGDRHVHVSIWRQKQRIRVYLNEDKIYDLPRAFPVNKPYSTLLFEILGDFKNQDRYLLSNIKFAVGAPDTRNKLITEGKFVTSGILFDVNSDKIKPESYGILKDIANVLTENSSVKVKIVGHTDSDGSDADNITLSKRRAESVKNSLVKDFGIDESRLETDGKGESQPIDSNATSQGKANNRRVEFLKL
jgi:outer membrane protein OmpA-like peptidoglycan-associated protein